MSEQIKQLEEKVNQTINEIKEQYLSNDGNLPWLIGYSGGKDSTCTSQLVFEAVKQLKDEGTRLSRKIIIFSSDTMIENPLVKEIVDKNLELINRKSDEYRLPIEAHSLSPKIADTFWVNIIGRGYPTPNTTFRWCTDRMKIVPANYFVKKHIDEAGEVIMVLGVREGESNTRDRVLKSYNIEGVRLMKHNSLPNAYVYAPIKRFNTTDVFLFLNVFESPWGSNNKELYFFYEESGGGECPIFLSQSDKTSSNSCGNSRLGCWCCTVVEKDKSLTGFIETGWHNELQPLLEFRNWLASIRDDIDYRNFYRMNGSVYTKKIDVKTDQQGDYLVIPKKGNRSKTIIRLSSDGDKHGFVIIEKDSLAEYMSENHLTFKDSKMAKVILKDSVTGTYYRIGTGPFNEKAKKEIFRNLIETEFKYSKACNKKTVLITNEEILEIKKQWLKSSIDVSYIDDVLKEFNREKVDIIQDSFEVINQKYEAKLRSILEKNNLDYETLNTLIQQEKELSLKTDRKEMLSFIDSTFKSDKVSF